MRPRTPIFARVLLLSIFTLKTSFNDNDCFLQFIIGTVTVCNYIELGYTLVRSECTFLKHAAIDVLRNRNQNAQYLHIESEVFKCFCIK